MAVGKAGKYKAMEMVLYSCPNCKSLGSAWLGGERPLMCASCYHDEVDIISPDLTVIDCPKCETPGKLETQGGEWE